MTTLAKLASKSHAARITERDLELRAVTFLSALVDQHPDAGIIAFDMNDLAKALRAGKSQINHVFADLNDMLSTRPMATALGGVWTLMQFELNTFFMVRADKAVGTTPSFNADDKRIERVRLDLPAA